MIKLEICPKQPFDIIAMTPRGTLGLCCLQIAQLMTHPAVYTLPFTLQLCYKPLDILQRVTKSQKVHISSHDVLQKSHTWGTPQNFLLAFIHELWKTQKIRISKKRKKPQKTNKQTKNTGDIITLHMCTKNHNQVQSLRYGVTQSFCHLGPSFALYHPPNTPEDQNFEKKKKASGDVIILNLWTKNTIKWCMLFQIWRVTDIIFCYFRSFFAHFLPHYWPGKLKL